MDPYTKLYLLCSTISVVTVACCLVMAHRDRDINIFSSKGVFGALLLTMLSAVFSPIVVMIVLTILGMAIIADSTPTEVKANVEQSVKEFRDFSHKVSRRAINMQTTRTATSIDYTKKMKALRILMFSVLMVVLISNIVSAIYSESYLVVLNFIGILALLSSLSIQLSWHIKNRSL